jgi:phenylacetate-CoA ligase
MQGAKDENVYIEAQLGGRCVSLEFISVGLLLAQMKINQWKTKDELERLQEEKLKELASYASANVPFYRKRFGDVAVRSLDDLQRLGVLTKADVKKDPNSLISLEFANESLIRTHTSGSTGIPLEIYHSPAESSYGLAFECHQLTEAGVGPFDLQVKVTHYQSELNFLQRLGAFRCSYLPVQEHESILLRRLGNLRPSVLCTYPSVLRILARLNERDEPRLGIKKVFAGGELLSQMMRESIERSFGCRVYDRYGCMETSWIAWQCEEGALHVHSDHVVVEITDDAGFPVREGCQGNIVVTPLWQRAMPFTRYITGDRASMGSGCRCGRKSHILKNLEGRSDDVLVLPSGKVRSARSINLMDDLSELAAYQIIQEKVDLFIFRYAPVRVLDESVKNEIRRRIRNGCLGEDVTVEFEEVGRIRRDTTGKIRTVVSKVGGRRFYG